MKEDLLHFIWQSLLFETKEIKSTDYCDIQIINRGTANNDAGPDFLNAIIKINNTILAGSIEIHVKSSDWQLHNHNRDKSYNNTILHVCWQYDKPAFRCDGTEITCITLKDKVKNELLDRFNYLMNNKNAIPCSYFIRNINSITLDLWEERLVAERLENKTKDIFANLENSKNDWQQSFYEMVAWSYGLKINSEIFISLAKHLPLKILSKHKNSIVQVEALLFGVAGFLNDNFTNEYFLELKKEFRFLKTKYNLIELTKESWKFLRLMPANFPTIRIAQLAYLIHKSENIFSKIVENPDIKFIESLLDTNTSKFWENHYNFETESSKKIKKFGTFSVHNIIINTVVPFLFAYGKYKDSDELKEQSIDILQKLPAEKNSIIKKWNTFDIFPKNSFQTQAILQLNNEYCNKLKCLNCNIGYKILKNVTD
ncbi:MAG: DUF2851 family protein [Bacteroidia bacterium]|nr:DUF2851 family protein [Bacteroidia bacterium]